MDGFHTSNRPANKTNEFMSSVNMTQNVSKVGGLDSWQMLFQRDVPVVEGMTSIKCYVCSQISWQLLHHQVVHDCANDIQP